MKEEWKSILIKAGLFCAYIWYGVSCFFLYYYQSIGYEGRYMSDLPLHINAAISKKHTYSLSGTIFKCLYKITDDTRLVAVFLVLVSVLTVYGTYCMLKFITETKKIRLSNNMLHVYSFLCNFAMSVYLPVIYEHSYSGTISGQAWHNSTYLEMRLLGILILILYFKMSNTYLYNISKGNAIIFVFGLIIVNMIKPNFILGFAPMMAINLCFDLLNAKIPLKKKIRQIMLFGMCVLPSLVVPLIQSQILFKEGSGNGIAIKLGYSFLRTGNPYAKIILGLMFPLYILALNYKKLKKDRIFASAWMMWVIAFTQYLFFVEIGPRQDHGNFAWGMLFATFVLFVVSVCELLRNEKEKKMSYYIGNILLILHSISGFLYFCYLVRGGYYLV